MAINKRDSVLLGRTKSRAASVTVSSERPVVKHRKIFAVCSSDAMELQ